MLDGWSKQSDETVNGRNMQAFEMLLFRYKKFEMGLHNYRTLPLCLTNAVGLVLGLLLILISDKRHVKKD